MRQKFSLVLFSILFSWIAPAQDFGFVVSNNWPLSNNSNAPFPLAWTGGINLTHWSHFDLNLDGQMDLVLFEKNGSRIIPFLNTGGNNNTNYAYAPEYISKFPKFTNWGFSRDYNGDGKMDLFCHVSAGIGVYKNVSNPTDGFKLEWMLNTPQLFTSYNGVNYINLYVSGSDIPSIEDIDGDGDLDILVEGILGASLEYHKNMSQEMFGHSDSMIFNNVTRCWGRFMESFTNNSVTLDTCLFGFATGGNSRHAGSTLLAIDLNGDGLRDLLIGDVTFTNVVKLVNGGSTQLAEMISQEINFPANDVPVDLTLFPGMFYLDVDKDGLKDLIVTPNSDNNSENFQSVWFYKNTGSASVPNFTFIKNNLIQDQMLDFGEGAFPVLFDYNNDGLMDIVVANHGYWQDISTYQPRLALLENVGTATQPAFKLITRDYAGLSNYPLPYGCIPTFGDMDGDGDKDMIVGDNNGNIHLFTNTASVGNPPVFVLTSPLFQGINVNSAAAPVLVDIDRDGDLDLLIGNFTGKISYYRNDAGTFSLQTDNFGGINVSGVFTTYGSSVPFVYERNGNYEMLVGSQFGYIHRYTNVENNLSGTFTLADTAFGNVLLGQRLAPAMHDFNGDGWRDLVVGNYAGGLNLYIGIDPATISIAEVSERTISVFPNPAKDWLNVSGTANSSLKYALHDLYGRMIDFGEIENGRISLSKVHSGIYVLTILESDKTTFHRVIIE